MQKERIKKLLQDMDWVVGKIKELKINYDENGQPGEQVTDCFNAVEALRAVVVLLESVKDDQPDAATKAFLAQSDLRIDDVIEQIEPELECVKALIVDLEITEGRN